MSWQPVPVPQLLGVPLAKSAHVWVDDEAEADTRILSDNRIEAEAG